MVYWKEMEVKQLRDKLELTQEQLAHKLGVTVKTVNRWERGRAKPSPLAVKLLDQLSEQLP
jgi:DNA-binding transcriptional regulator YiaG